MIYMFTVKCRWYSVALDGLVQKRFSKHTRFGVKPNIIKKKKYWISSKTGLDETLFDNTWTYQPFPLLDVTYIPIFKDREQLKFNNKLEGTKTLQW